MAHVDEVVDDGVGGALVALALEGRRHVADDLCRVEQSKVTLNI